MVPKWGCSMEWDETLRLKFSLCRQGCEYTNHVLNWQYKQNAWRLRQEKKIVTYFGWRKLGKILWEGGIWVGSFPQVKEREMREKGLERWWKDRDQWGGGHRDMRAKTLKNVSLSICPICLKMNDLFWDFTSDPGTCVQSHQPRPVLIAATQSCSPCGGKGLLHVLHRPHPSTAPFTEGLRIP